MSIESCERHELINCAICNRASQPPKPSQPASQGRFRSAAEVYRKLAEFETLCAPCGEMIQIGDPIVSTPGGAWIHEECQ